MTEIINELKITIVTWTGLGNSASHHLVKGMARAGNGTALFALLTEERNLEKKVMQQLKDALQPALTGNRHTIWKHGNQWFKSIWGFIYSKDININWEGYEE